MSGWAAVRVPLELHERIKGLARGEQRTMAAVVERALDVYEGASSLARGVADAEAGRVRDLGSFADESRGGGHGAQGEPVTAVGMAALETPAAPPCSHPKDRRKRGASGLVVCGDCGSQVK